MRVVLLPATGVISVAESFTATSSEHFLGGGENGDFVDLKGHVAVERVSYTCGSEFPMPYYVSSRGYGIFARNLSVGQLAFPGAEGVHSCGGQVTPQCPLTPAADRVEMCFKSSSLHYEVYAGPPAVVQRKFSLDAGRPAAAEPAQFGGEKWRGNWDDNTGTTLLADAAKYRELGIPLTWMHINDPWETNECWGTLEFDKSRFPDPAGMIRTLAKGGLRTMLWVSPLVTLQAGCPPPPYAHLLGGGASPMIDLTEQAQAVTFEKALRRVLALGIDGIKADRGDEYDLEPSPLARGGGSVDQNRYPVLYARAVIAALRASAPHGYSAIFRAGAEGSQTVAPGFWVGDEPGTYGGMATALRAGLTASVSGVPVWGSDIGGYVNAAPSLTGELFVRWAQLGAVSPIFEVGGQGESSHFWDFGPSVTSAFRDAAVLHYELVPYLLDLSRTATTTGLPITRPLGFSYPTDQIGWSVPNEFTIGASLLAAPVVGPGTTPRVYLPRGRWLDLFNGNVSTGPAAFTRPTPDNQFPLYLHAGAAIPFNLRSPNIWAVPWRLSDLVRSDRAGWLIAPGGSGEATSTTAGTIHIRQRGTQLTINLVAVPTDVELLVLTNTPPLDVTIDGISTAPTSAPALRHVAAGWTFKTQPVGGAVIKLAGNSGATHVTLDLR